MGGKIFMYCLFAVVLFGFVPNKASAKTFIVNSNLDIDQVCENVCTLRGALAESNSNDESDYIRFNHNIKHIKINSPLVISGDTIIRGNVKIDAQMKSRVFEIAQNAEVVFSRLSITGGYVTSSPNIEGAGIRNNGNLKLYNVRVFGNQLKQTNFENESEVYARGAGIMNAGGAELEIVGSVIGPRNYIFTAGYDASSLGAGIYNSGDINMRKTNIWGNTLYAKSYGDQGYAKAHGGGIYNTGFGVMNIKTSSIYINNVYARISGNAQFAKAQGAGMYFKPWAEMNMTNSTISSNKATALGVGGPYGITFAHGGGLYVGVYSKLHFANVTIAENKLSTPDSAIPAGTEVGSGIFVVKTSDTKVIFKNSIMSNPGKNCNVGIDSEGYNIAIDSSCYLKKIGDTQNTDPQIGELLKNDSFTLTHALKINSLAINAGNPDGCYDFENNLLTFDQRGKYRPQNSCDVGAYEF